MSDESQEAAFFTLLKQTIESHGCSIVAVDFEKRILNLDGPEESMAACALAISKMLD
jgi:hypothetical protein